MKHFRPQFHWLIPLTIFVVSLFLRTYKLPETYLFGADEEYQATYARTITDNFHLVWIGVSAANTGFYLGPYWTYLTAGLIQLSSDPLLTGYFASLLGAITATTIYLLGKDLFGKKSGLLAAFFYIFSPLVVYFDQKYWNPSSLPLLSLLLIYSVIKIKNNHNWLYLFAISIGLIFHVHLSLVPVAFVLSIYFFRDIIHVGRRKLAVATILFLLTISPLIVFDYYHSYSNITAPFRWGEISSGLSGNSWDNAQNAITMLGRLWYLEPGLSSANEARPVCQDDSTTTPHILIIILSIIPLAIFGLTRNHLDKKRNWGIIIALLAIILPFIFYPGENAEYYLLGVIPIYFLIVASILSRLKLKIVLPIIITFSSFALKTLYLNNPIYGLAVKKELIHQTMQYIDGADFTLSEHGECHRYAGWRYLYTVYGNWPLRSSIDSSYGWLYPREISHNRARYSIAIYGTGPIPDINAEYFYSGGFTAIVKEL